MGSSPCQNCSHAFECRFEKKWQDFRCPGYHKAPTSSLDDAELARLRAEVERLEGKLATESRIAKGLAELADALESWTHQFGAELCPGLKPDTYGEGVRASKEAVSRILSAAWARQKEVGK